MGQSYRFINERSREMIAPEEHWWGRGLVGKDESTGGVTAIILDADMDGSGGEICGDIGWLLAVDGNLLVSGGVVGWTGGNSEDVFICHLRN